MARLGLASSSQEMERLLSEQFLGGFGAPEDVASAVRFLASDASVHVNGVSLVIDGGALAA